MNGDVQRKSLSKEYLTSLSIEKLLEVILLMIAGALAIVLHARLRMPLGVPGHHGIMFMTIILTARLSSKIKWASCISAIGIGIFILFPVLGFSDPMSGFNYMLPCIALDIIYNGTKNLKHRKFIIAIGAGIGYLMVPISRLLFTLGTGYIFPSFIKHGYIIPLVTFFVFGFLGGLLGTGLYGLIRKLTNKV